jgi:hypothetical protein
VQLFYEQLHSPVSHLISCSHYWLSQPRDEDSDLM